MSKILYITPSLNIGGAEKHVAFLASQFKALHEVKLVSMFAGGPLSKMLEDSVLDVEFITSRYIRASDKILLKNPYDYVSRRLGQRRDKIKLPNDSRWRIRIREKAIKDTIKRFSPDVLHVHTLHCSDVLRWGYELGIKKRVFTHHNILSKRHLNRDIQRLSENIEYATDITFVSNYQKTDLLKALRKNIDGSIISPISGFSGSIKNLRDQSSQVFKLGTLSNLAPVKGVKYLIEATNLLFKSGLNVQLYIGGDGNYRSHLQELSSNIECSQHIHFMGKLHCFEEVDRFYRKIDAFVLPSLSESFGIVLIEAMSYGLPIVASDLPAVKEIITDQFNGLVVQPAEIEDLAQKIRLVIQDNALRKQITVNAIKTYSEKFNADAIIGSYSLVYNLSQ